MKLNVMGLIGAMLMTLAAIYVYNKWIAKDGASIANLGKA